MASHFGNGWAPSMFAARYPPGNDCFYYGGDAAFDEALPALQKLHPEYRMNTTPIRIRNGRITLHGSRKCQTPDAL